MSFSSLVAYLRADNNTRKELQAQLEEAGIKPSDLTTEITLFSRLCEGKLSFFFFWLLFFILIIWRYPLPMFSYLFIFYHFLFIRRDRCIMWKSCWLSARSSSLSRSPCHSWGRGRVSDSGEIGGVQVCFQLSKSCVHMLLFTLIITLFDTNILCHVSLTQSLVSS